MGSRGRAQAESHASEDFDDEEEVDPILNLIKFGLSTVNKCANETLPKCSTGQRKQDMSGRMENLMLRLIKTELVYNQTKELTKRVEEEVTPDAAETDSETILKACDDIAEESTRRIEDYEKSLTNQQLKQHKKYTKLMHDMEAAMSASPRSPKKGRHAAPPVRIDSDNDEAETEEEEEEEGTEDEDVSVQHSEDSAPAIDPVTKKTLTDPIRNKKCNHVYGKASITQLIRMNNKLRCPIPGCSNKDFLRISHLVEDNKKGSPKASRKGRSPGKKRRSRR